MRGVQHPVGPQSESVYWRRRAILVVGVVLVLVLLIWLIGRTLGGSGGSAQTAPSQTPIPINPSWTDTVWDTSTPTPSSQSPSPSSAAASPSDSASAATPASPSASGSSPSASSPTPTPTASAAACELSQLSSSITSPASTVRRGSTVPLTVTVTNRGDAACVWDLKRLPVQVSVDSGVDRIWSTGDCGRWGPDGDHPIASGKTWSFTVQWPTRRSSKGSCTLSGEELGTGTYVATAQVEGGTERQFVMRLTS